MISLRPYQQLAVDAAMGNENGICVLPTGSGKSLCIAGIVNRVNDRVLVMQPTKEILESNYEKIQASGFDDAKIFSASVGIKEVGKCTYATIGSIIKKLDLFAGTDTLIIDECHLVNSKGGQYRTLIETLKPKRLIGLTATPYRLHTTMAGSDVRMLSRTRPKMFDKIIHVTQTADLARDGFLHQPEYIVSGSEGKNLLRLNSTGAEFSDQSVDNYLRKTKIVQRTVEAAKSAIENGAKHLLIFTPSLEQSGETVAALRVEGITADSVSSESSKTDRENKLAAFKSGEITAMVNVGVLTTGYDFPALDCIISARPTASLALYYQIIGRCVRSHPSKKRAFVYDLVDNFSRFDDPMQYRIVESTKGIHSVLSIKGRLTNRLIGCTPECEDMIEFGKYKGDWLCEISDEYISWYLKEAKKSETWHSFRFEQLRREIFLNGEEKHLMNLQYGTSLTDTICA